MEAETIPPDRVVEAQLRISPLPDPRRAEGFTGALAAWLVCETDTDTGSHICRTRWQIEEERRSAQQELGTRPRPAPAADPNLPSGGP